jgi:hypothetical protein
MGVLFLFHRLLIVVAECVILLLGLLLWVAVVGIQDLNAEGLLLDLLGLFLRLSQSFQELLLLKTVYFLLT